MNILAIDIGSYSIKIVELRPERKHCTLVEKQEIILEDVRPHYPNATTLLALQNEILANYLQKKSSDLKVIFQLPSEMLTTRYLDIPGKSKKKAEMVIPFQLEENLPYPLSGAHYSYKITKNNNSFSVLGNITQLSAFKDFFDYFENKNITPSTLTSEISVMQTYIDQLRLNETCCIIDLGHKTTKVYFVQGRKIVSNHTSYVAGNLINEVISKTYQISIEDSIIYKHENAFMLNDEQLTSVTNEQKNFALLMKQIFNPLINDIKRWEIGHKIKFGTNIEKIYVLGGTSYINNIDNFIYYHTGIPVSHLPTIPDLKKDYSSQDRNFHLVKMMGYAQKTPSILINFLIGKFQNTSNAFIPLHSASFLWVRTSTIALLFILALVGEKYLYLNNQNKAIDSKIKALIKKPTLGISTADRKAYDKTPSRILTTIRKKNKIVTDEVSSILSSQTVNALKPLVALSKKIENNPNISMTSFTSDGITSKAVFESSDTIEIERLNDHIKSVGLKNLSTKFNQGDTKLYVEFEDME